MRNQKRNFSLVVVATLLSLSFSQSCVKKEDLCRQCVAKYSNGQIAHEETACSADAEQDFKAKWHFPPGVTVECK